MFWKYTLDRVILDYICIEEHWWMVFIKVEFREKRCNNTDVTKDTPFRIETRAVKKEHSINEEGSE